MLPGMPGKRTNVYVRHGTTSLFAAFNTADGTVISSIHRRHRAIEFKKFLTKIDADVPEDLDVHPSNDFYNELLVRTLAVLSGRAPTLKDPHRDEHEADAEGERRADHRQTLQRPGHLRITGCRRIGSEHPIGDDAADADHDQHDTDHQQSRSAAWRSNTLDAGHTAMVRSPAATRQGIGRRAAGC